MRILIIDNLEVVYEGLKSHFKKQNSQTELHWATNLHVAEKQIKTFKYDLIISELDFDDVDGLEILEALYKRFKIKLTLHTSKRNEFRLKWLHENSFVNHVCFKEDGIKGFHNEDTVSCNLQKNPLQTKGLSKREEEVLSFITQGFTNKIIASRLQLSDKTVATYKHRLLKKLGLNSDYELFAIQRKTGIDHFVMAS